MVSPCCVFFPLGESPGSARAQAASELQGEEHVAELGICVAVLNRSRHVMGRSFCNVIAMKSWICGEWIYSESESIRIMCFWNCDQYIIRIVYDDDFDVISYDVINFGEFSNHCIYRHDRHLCRLSPHQRWIHPPFLCPSPTNRLKWTRRVSHDIPVV